MSEFGKFERVEKADGTEVTAGELLEMARDAAFNAIVSDIATDDASRFYIGWLNLFGFTEAEHDDIRRITQIGLNIDVGGLIANHILVRKGNKECLAGYRDRIEHNSKLGEKSNSFTIDRVHKLMHLYKAGNRKMLITYIGEHAGSSEQMIWRVVNSLSEILPKGTEDYTIIAGLIANKENLLREASAEKNGGARQEELGLE